MYQALRRDDWRKTHPFSDDVATVNSLLFDTYATGDERREQLSNWLQGKGKQPCLFGRVAAGSHNLHFCVLTEEDFLAKSDERIAQKIQDDLLDWKRRSLRPAPDFSTPAFGFVLLAASSHLANAAPDDRLLAFAIKLRDLWGCPGSEEPSGTMHWETLYIRNPENERYVRFTFGVDFFAAQGDGRWWHDHRAPGGLMFTANSIGYMQKYREWYKGMAGQEEWVLKTAMLTIDEAKKTAYGKATWLRDLSSDQKPLESLPCPFAKQNNLKSQLVGKDWTKYAGWLHTDHSIRPEFFRQNPEPSPEIESKEYLEDFTYLYSPATKDHARFVEGDEVTPEEVAEKLGAIGDWRDVFHKKPKTTQVRTLDSGAKITPDALKHRQKIQELLDMGRRWRMSPEELKDLE